ncbi:MAG: NUDIX domain-containing protein [Brevibacterium sp.]|uniref:NUDIX domain-containing protein n=1 Tax=Brevibacterium sp. TaxID=1701 RepID=UPI0026474AFB|nr:NUDIX domain-containing protein [Brevibacterium sp.]MDN5805900.1 NUDIX domain-containing protein [Brevibacterium sp.]MDN6133309.1 NUDIX domain-containing protein [Brevibacterium sp.]MDN6158203.1 NUDIX domain-containing protein [Brevibacterium sp.]MDN6174777.1 NUDIX domain-containing protein [Brevibacterium sp.]MDN6187747.1 NUDIX domain-containing protein [Brevibacterium sp.]
MSSSDPNAGDQNAYTHDTSGASRDETAYGPNSKDLPDFLPTRRSGDGWTLGSDGQKHWGLNGAAGLMLLDPEQGILMQHRALWSVEGGTWGFPGGARDLGESAIDAAVRESFEEAGVPDLEAEGIEILETYVLDLGDWSYTTVIARTLRHFEPVINDPESIELAWVPIDRLTDYSLHSGVAASLPALLELLRPHL